MAKKAGVWIDHKQAIVVLLTDAGHETKKITFDAGEPLGARSKRIAENRLEEKVKNHRKDYFNDVIAAVTGAESLLIFGPGEAKGELKKHIAAKKLRGLTVALETTDEMTDRQIAAKVIEHFATAPGKAAGASKKESKVMSGQRSKKSGK